MIGYLDLPSGLSGDMFLGCLVDAGWGIEPLRDTLGRLKLPASSWSVEARSVLKGALRATLVDVRVEEGHAHHHEGHAHHHAPHRNLHDIRRIIEGADLSASVKSRAIDVFTRLGQA